MGSSWPNTAQQTTTKWNSTAAAGLFGQRFPLLCKVLRELPVRTTIIDGEVAASDAACIPDFLASVPSLSEACPTPRVGV
jgi:hypothetical protein